MIDLHSHILPGADDGAATLEDAVAMAAAAVNDGIRLVAATPHHNDGCYANPAGSVLEAVDALNAELAARRIPLTVIPGQELRVGAGFWEEFGRGRALTLNRSRYLLIELPPDRVPGDLAETVYELTLEGIVPVIAHPERNAGLARDMRLLEELVKLGALAQVTAHSLCGHFGRRLRKLALEMCAGNLIHLVASDAHDAKRRPFAMKEAMAAVRRELGEEYAAYYAENAAAVAENREIAPGPAGAGRKRKFPRW